MNEEQITIDWHSLWQFTKAVFMAVGLSPGDAATEADVLVWANLRGVDSHGVQRIPMYVRMVEGGLIKPDAQIRVVKERPAGLLVEADHAFGPVVTVFTMERLIQKARDVGAAFAFIRNTTHQGAMGYYPLLAARRGMAGLAWVCNPPNMAPYGAKAAGVHNSPLAIAVPGAEREAVILDMATSIAAAGKVDVARDKGIPIPADWALDADGSPTTDPNQAKIMRPFGRYKGYGLAFMLAGLSSLMVGNPLIVPRLRDTDDQPPLGTQNSALAVIDIESWTDLDDYQENLDELVEAIKDLPKAQGVEEIFVPGEPEDRVREVREATGIPLPTGTAERLQEVADQLEIPVPWTLR
jgi:LDH2 family malate/lactate/ureidoglycolate dehydrogenase